MTIARLKQEEQRFSGWGLDFDQSEALFLLRRLLLRLFAFSSALLLPVFLTAAAL
eukprot:m.47412 g.47412  ORF g.47412 m.47412 type:complete len:55 (+) comp10977_c2_seq1:530-694(+)